jgi:magnesium transporter
MEVAAEEKQDKWTTLEALINLGDRSRLDTFLEDLATVDLTRAFSRLDKDGQIRLLEIIGYEKSAGLIAKISDVGVPNIFAQLPQAQAVPIVEEMPSDRQADVLQKLNEDYAESILQDMEAVSAQKIRQLMRYPENTAGGLMITEYLHYTGQQRIKDVLDDLQRHSEIYSDFDVQYVYVVSDSGKLVGVLRLRDLLLTPKDKPIIEIMIKKPLKVEVDASLQALRDFFRQYSFLAAPVTDSQGNLVGVVRGSSVREAANRRNNQLFLKFAGIVGGEEFRTMSLFRRSSRRLSWLSINIILNIIAASVIALYQDTLEKAIVLAVFLPIISDMSGCSGNQAVAVSIRELTLGLVRPREILRVLSKESAIGIINGIVLGCLLGGAALLWKGNPYLGLVVGAALAANTFVAVSFGGLVPLMLRGMRTDPALASGPLLTTITDMCGFFFVLSFASFMLPKLSG